MLVGQTSNISNYRKKVKNVIVTIMKQNMHIQNVGVNTCKSPRTRPAAQQALSKCELLLLLMLGAITALNVMSTLGLTKCKKHN